MTRRGWSSGVLSLVFFVSSCSSKDRPAACLNCIGGSGGSTGGDTNAGSSGGGSSGLAGEGGGAGSGGSGACVGKPGTTEMVQVEIDAETSYCIDVHEVTSDAYQRFFDATITNQPMVPGCGAVNPARTESTFGAQPAAGVSWCQASAYCRYAGKRLCGKIGGGVVDDSLAADEQGEWFHACTNGLETVYPYGDDFIDNRCNDPGFAALADVKQFAECHGTREPFDVIYDLDGNLFEWIDNCSQAGAAPDGEDVCVLRGGNYLIGGQPDAETRCDYIGEVQKRGVRAKNFGIRCCR